jgi:hypothetical protein
MPERCPEIPFCLMCRGLCFMGDMSSYGFQSPDAVVRRRLSGTDVTVGERVDASVFDTVGGKKQ